MGIANPWPNVKTTQFDRSICGIFLPNICINIYIKYICIYVYISHTWNTKQFIQYFACTRLEKQSQSDVQLSERLASLGIMRAQLRAHLKSPVHRSTIVLRGLKGVLEIRLLLWRETPVCRCEQNFRKITKSLNRKIQFSSPKIEDLNDDFVKISSPYVLKFPRKILKYLFVFTWNFF